MREPNTIPLHAPEDRNQGSKAAGNQPLSFPQMKSQGAPNASLEAELELADSMTEKKRKDTSTAMFYLFVLSSTYEENVCTFFSDHQKKSSYAVGAH